MSKYENEILRTVNLHGRVSVVDLAQALNVSDQTIRRIVRPLVDSGQIAKVHGALVATKGELDPPFSARMNTNRSAKVAIAHAIRDLIPDGASLAIDTGSTSGFVAQALRERRDLTVVTNSAVIAATLAMENGNRVFMAGTQLRNHDGAAFDRAAFDVIANMSVDFAILSASLVHPARGFMVFEQCEVDMAIAMKSVGERSIMAVDSTKFEATDSKPALRLPGLEAQDLLITDQKPGKQFDVVTGAAQVVVAGG